MLTRLLYRFTRRPNGKAPAPAAALQVEAPPPPPAPAPAPPPAVEVTPVPPEGLQDELHYLTENIPDFTLKLNDQRACLRAWNTPTLQALPPSSYVGKDVLEIGSGLGGACALFLACGARSVWGFEPLMTEDTARHLAILRNARFTRGVLTEEAVAGHQFDLVYALFVTEHVGDLGALFHLVRRLLRPGGRFVALHANYYGPLGGHDHAFIVPQATDRGVLMASRAPHCWELPERCEASADFRRQCEARSEWTVKEWDLTPDDCSRCLYYHRAQVWAHLLYQDEYTRNYPGPTNACGYDGGLNKVTPFQVRQFLVEAGFRIDVWVEDLCVNEPPAALLERFTERDLRISNILFSACCGD